MVEAGARKRAASRRFLQLVARGCSAAMHPDASASQGNPGGVDLVESAPLARQGGGRVAGVRCRPYEQRPAAPSQIQVPPSPGFEGAADKGAVRARLDADKGKIVFGGLEIRWRIVSRKRSFPVRPKAGIEWFDADAVGREVVLRHWKRGDRFQPIGMPTPVKLQDLFTNQRIPRKQRHDLVVVATGEGILVWVEKLRISERFKLSTGTIRHLQWRWKRL